VEVPNRISSSVIASIHFFTGLEAILALVQIKGPMIAAEIPAATLAGHVGAPHAIQGFTAVAILG
jgi:hypothetical protein